MSLDPAKQIFLTSDHTITKIIALCDPDQALSSVLEHLEFSGKQLDLLHNGVTELHPLYYRIRLLTTAVYIRLLIFKNDLAINASSYHILALSRHIG